MSYYMGDYRGDFYPPMGDPGIGSFFKRIVGGAVSLIPGVGPLASRAIGALGGRRAPAAIMRPAAAAITGAAGNVTRAIVAHPVLSAAGAAGALAGAGALMHGGARRGRTGTPGERGFHESKKHPGMWVRNRRMNVANGRALARATRRLHAFARRYRKVVGFVSPRRPKGRMYFKKRRHARAA